MKKPEPEEKKCGESCGCSPSQKIKKDEKITNAEITFPNQETKQNKIEQDPTRFGDWQVNGRAIDF
ncbi:MAG: DUF1674 domain-containing protein [Rickettsiales bacterium]|nr:DUF1674 domain-containing protein [Rickettsiales bacterium]